ncbi:IS66 family transposase [Oscillatoria nigro-viridis]|uniref:IS66 family transposase n=1 Tax=Phormidium nigroviride TaxID=482564 RepID=UPI000684D3F7|nr:transposase [Oscillatoria nigro-viridis]
MAVAAPVVKPSILPQYLLEWNQVHHLAGRFKARVTYLRYTHAIGYERLSGILSSVFGLKISEGAIANLLSTVKTSLDEQVNQILQRLRQAKLICGR